VQVFGLLRGRFGPILRRHVSLSLYTSFRLGGPAEVMAWPRHPEELAELVWWLRRHEVPYWLLGRGTKLVVRDGGVQGVAINTAFLRRWYLEDRGDEVVLQAEAGAPLPALLRCCLRLGLRGLEFTAGIPGSLGGAVRMNAGTHRGSMGQVVREVWWLDVAGQLVRRPVEFFYRGCLLPPEGVILGATLLLQRDDPGCLRKEVWRLRRRRAERQPLGLPSAGSVFKNPPGMRAARLIEEAGLKGTHRGGAMISPQHANFIVNLGGARGRDVLELMEYARDQVHRRTGVLLEPEVQVVGEG